MTTADRQDRIERYLRGRMTETERADFQTDLLFDTELKQELAATRDLQKTLRARQPKPPRPRGTIWFTGILLLGVVVLLGFWTLRGTDTDAALSNFPVRTTPEVSTPTEATAPTEVLERPTEERTDEPIYTPPVVPERTRPEPTDEPAVPIAYAPNPVLERAAVNLRGLDYELTLRPPAARVSSAELLVFSGTVATEVDAPELQLHLVSNRTADYQNRNYLRSQPLELLPTGSGYRFEQQLEGNLANGRYYWLVEDLNEEAVIRVGWVEVKD